MTTEFPDADPVQAENAWAQELGYGGEAEEDQASHIQHSDEEQEPDFSVAAALRTSGESPPSHDSTPQDVGDYDPASVNVLSSTLQVQEQKPPQPSPQPTSRKPKTAGGFLVGDSDSEDEEAESASNTPVPPNHATALPTQHPLQHSISAHDVGDGEPSSAVDPRVAAASAAGAQSSAQSSLVRPSIAARLPNDTIGILEDQVKEDPRGAMDSWLALIAEYRRRNKVEDARAVYERFLAIFPQAADVWVAYMEMEIGLSNFQAAESLFGRSLLSVPHVQLWTVYLDYIRRRNDLSDTSGQSRQTVTQAYEFVLDNVGLDKDSGKIWADYIQFIRYAPGQIGGSTWQDQQKMDQLRKAYQRAVCVPISIVNTLWKDYDHFEQGLNKLTARKFLAERSPAYMTAKSANTALENITRGLVRTNLPRLPPAPGFEGDQEYLEQVEIWKKWIAWEKSDPLELKDEEPALLQKRILYCYKQALMALRFWPEMWVDASEWCFENGISQDGKDVGLDFLVRGIEANPESVLLALKHADRIEMTYPVEEGNEAKVARGSAVRAPYQQVLDTLYDILKGLKEKEKAELARIEEAFKAEAAVLSGIDRAADDDDDSDPSDMEAKKSAKENKLKAIQQGFSAQTQLISRTLSFVWVALARAMRRIQGKGVVNDPLGGLRQVFTDARQRGRLTSDVYVAVALLEWNIYKDNAGGKIFERGAKLFPEDENFMTEYLKYLHSRDDITNARVVFETCVNRLTQKPDLIHKAKPLYAYFHKYESQYGELSQIAKLERRMTELFPDDPKLSVFHARFSTEKFDPIAARIIVSPAAQLRPRIILPSIEQRASVVPNSPRPSLRQQNSPRPQFLQATNSPKRPFPVDDLEDSNPPRKMQRGESPLKGAAGRRLDQQRRMQGQSAALTSTGPAPISRDITFLLGLIPPASSYDSTRFNPSSMVRLLRDTSVPDYSSWKNTRDRDLRTDGPRLGGVVHNRQASTDYAQYPYQSRESPRPQSPYDGGRGRLAPASTTYRQSSLRPGSSGSYEPPPAVYRQDVPPPHYGPPPGQVPIPVPDVGGTPTWSPAPGSYGVPPPQGYAPPPQYGQQPPQQPPFNRYY